MPNDADLLPVREAAVQAGTKRYLLYEWMGRGMLPTQPSSRGRLVSLTAVRALVAALPARPSRATPEPREIPGDTAEYVLPYLAARHTGVSRSTVGTWGRTGQVASKPGRYGR